MNKLLQQLTPAEILLIRNGDTSPKNELLKVTMMDLLLKEVLRIEKVERQPNSRDPISIFKYVTQGTNFVNYAARPYELPFLTDFQKSPGLKMLFKNCVQAAFDHVPQSRTLRKLIRSTPALETAFSQNFIERMLGQFSYSTKGLELRDALNKEIETLELEIPKLMISDRTEALQKLAAIGGNIFLLKGLRLGLLSEIEQEFLKNTPPKNSHEGCGGGCATFTSHSSDFDSSSPSDGAGDGGCSSGDSGCGSGCGGGD